MNDTTIIHTSRAQYRILRRLARGERLPLSRYRPEHATMRALRSKALVGPIEIDGMPETRQWALSSLGLRVAASRNGFMAPRPRIVEADVSVAHWRSNAAPPRRHR